MYVDLISLMGVFCCAAPTALTATTFIFSFPEYSVDDIQLLRRSEQDLQTSFDGRYEERKNRMYCIQWFLFMILLPVNNKSAKK